MNNDSLIGKLEALICNPYCKADDAHNNAVKQCVTIIRQHTAAPDVERVAEAIYKSVYGIEQDYRYSEHAELYRRHAKAAIAAMGEESFRKGEPLDGLGDALSPSPASDHVVDANDMIQASEISDVNAPLASEIFRILNTYMRSEDLTYLNRLSRAIEKVLEAIRPHIRPTKPVMSGDSND